jgi:HAD superfamily hydrolase (TIGR01549 family)
LRGKTDRGVVFDFDLTLVDLRLDHDTMVEHLKRATSALGISHLVTSWSSAFGVYRELVDEVLLEDPERDRVKRRLDQAMAAGEYGAYPLAEAYPGAKEVLEYLSIRGFRIGLVSSNSLRVIESTSRKFRLWRFFDAVWGRESYGRSKPAPDKLRGCLAQLGIERGFYVGDDPSDMDAAVQASCRGIAVIRVTDRLPTPSPAVLRERGAERLVWGVKELPGVFEELLPG